MPWSVFEAAGVEPAILRFWNLKRGFALAANCLDDSIRFSKNLASLKRIRIGGGLLSLARFVVLQANVAANFCEREVPVWRQRLAEG
jgi:hypothetical protein